MARLGEPQSRDTLVRSLKRAAVNQAAVASVRMIGVVSTHRPLPKAHRRHDRPPIASTCCKICSTTHTV